MSHADAVLGHLGGGGDSGLPSLWSPLSTSLREARTVFRFEHVIRPTGVDDDFLGPDRAGDGELLRGVRRADATLPLLTTIQVFVGPDCAPSP